ncbi:MAG: 4-hydroxy-tetrahydrodipicolinate synthase [Dehalococcoidia bacterium]
MTELGRLLTAMVTPFDERGEVDYQQAKRLASALLDSGSDGVVVSGTTGESPTLTTEEKLRLWAEVKAELGDRGTVVAGAGTYSTAESMDMVQEAEKLGVDAIMLVVPYYNKPPQEGLYEHFKVIAGTTSLPCIIYNVPSRTVTDITDETVIKLSQIDNIVGIKEASGNFNQITKIISGAGEGFRVWSGNDGDTLPILALGGYGIISVASHLVGAQIKEMIHKFVEGDHAAAARIHSHLLPLVNTLFKITSPIPLKYAMKMVGFDVGRTRLPLNEPDEGTQAAVLGALKKYRIDLPVPSPR